MKKIILLFVLHAAISYLFSQDKSEIAVALYQKAENFFNQTEYESAYTILLQAEENLGSTNTKILYLKAKSLQQLIKADGKFLPALKQTLDAFYARVKKQTYSQEKYNEMVLLSTELQKLVAEEENTYNAIRASNNIDDYDAFYAKFPSSIFRQNLDANYDKLKRERETQKSAALEKAKAEQAKRAAEVWKTDNLPLKKKYKRTAIARVVVGPVLLCAGAGMMYYGFKPETVSGFNYYGNPNYETGTYTFLELSDLDDDLFFKKILVGCFGFAAALTGTLVTVSSAKYFKRVKKLNREANSRGIELSFIPTGNGINFSMTF